jgi:hypothetical protein
LCARVGYTGEEEKSENEDEDPGETFSEKNVKRNEVDSALVLF